MTDNPEELLKDDVATAAKALDAAREMRHSPDLTPQEAEAHYQAAFERYKAAMRRFSDFVIHRKLPG